MSTPRVYVASPLGFTEHGRRFLSDVLHPTLSAAGFDVADPWADPDGIVATTMATDPTSPEYLPTLGAMNRTLGLANASAIATSDAVLAVLDGSDVDSGTASEIGYAAGVGVPVVGLRTDLRTGGENAAAVVNLQVQFFIETTGGVIHRSVDDAVGSLGALIDDRHLFHIARRATWESAVESGTYTASTRDQSLKEVGFIHLSFARQLAATAERHYSDIDARDLVLLTVDRKRLSSPLRVELAPSVGDSFPHIYGPLNLDAVVAVVDVERTAGGGLAPIR